MGPCRCARTAFPGLMHAFTLVNHRCVIRRLECKNQVQQTFCTAQACHIMMCIDLLHDNRFSYSSCSSISLHEYLPHTLMQVWDRSGSTLLAAAASSVLLLCHLHLSLPAELLLLIIGCFKIDGTKEYIQKQKCITKPAGLDTLRGQ